MSTKPEARRWRRQAIRHGALCELRELLPALQAAAAGDKRHDALALCIDASELLVFLEHVPPVKITQLDGRKRGRKPGVRKAARSSDKAAPVQIQAAPSQSTAA